MYPPLEAAWAKYNRAARDLSTLHENRTRFLDRQPYRVVVELDSVSGWWVARTLIVEEPPPVFGVLAGSMAHQLYSALNHVTFALAVANLGPDDAHRQRRQLDFPIFETQKAFRSARALKHLNPKAVGTIEALQPYHREPNRDGRVQHPLLLVKELADADKHRVLPFTYGSVDLADVFSGVAFGWDHLATNDGEPEFERLLPHDDHGSTLVSGTPLVRLRFHEQNADAMVRVDRQPETDLAFDSDTWAGLSLWSLGNCGATVDRCITHLAPLFPGHAWPPASHDPHSPYVW